MRLPEKIAFAEVLSNGRTETGIGGGYSVEEFRGLGVPYRRRRELAWSVVDRIIQRSVPVRPADPDQNDTTDSSKDRAGRVAIVGNPNDVIEQREELQQRIGGPPSTFWYHAVEHRLLTDAIRLFGEAVVPRFYRRSAAACA